MTAFRKKSLLPSKRICLRLKDMRETAGLSVGELAKRSKIDRKYIEAIEACEFETLPRGTVYQKNFVKQYLKALGMNPKPFVRQFVDEEMRYMTSDREHPKTHIRRLRLSSVPTALRYGALAAIVLVLIGYLGMQVKRILEPPELTLLSPQDGFISNQATVTVQGKTEKEVRLSINGTEITNTEDGKFDETIHLNPGLNTIIVTAEKKHGKKATETRYVVLKETTEDL